MEMTKKLFPILCLLVPATTFAHTGHGGAGFSSGLTHPVFGFDHFLAMLSVGMLSAQMGGRAIWTVPATFVLFVLIGGIMGMKGFQIFSVETGIAVSVIALGLALVADKKIPVLAAMGGVALFGIFHGHAHGTEMPGFAQPVLYASGFVLGTAVIHLLGVGLGWLATRNRIGSISLRAGGAAIALCGIFFLFSATNTVKAEDSLSISVQTCPSPSVR
jgi:urease accessory protein